jgi:hypothetical protein
MRRVVVLLCLLPWLAHAENITSATCTPAVTTGCFTRNTVGFSSVFVDVSGTWTGSLVFEVAGNAAGPWHSSRAYTPDGNGAYAVAVTANGSWSVPTFGAPLLRVRAAALSSGSATVTAQASSFQIPTDIVRAVGATFGEVQVSGTVDLSSATLASMGNYICAAAESHRLNLTTTPTIIPSEGPIAGRTSWTLVNVDSVKKVSCRVDPGDGGVPDCNTPGFGLTVQPNGGTLTFPVRESDTVRCVACTNGATVEHTEEACVAP